MDVATDIRFRLINDFVCVLIPYPVVSIIGVDLRSSFNVRPHVLLRYTLGAIRNHCGFDAFGFTPVSR